MALIEAFNSVRNIVYHCPESRRDVDARCWGKQRMLFKKIKKLGYKVRYRVCEFKWRELKLPKEITDKAPKKTDYHLYLEIEIDGKWTKVDASDDPGLGLVEWDGKHDTKLSVKCLKVLSPEESAKVESDEKENYDKILKEYREFYIAINRFLERIRKK